jgi:hypothetical protein
MRGGLPWVDMMDVHSQVHTSYVGKQEERERGAVESPRKLQIALMMGNRLWGTEEDTTVGSNQ